MWCGSFGPRGRRRVVYGRTRQDVREKLLAIQLELQRRHLRTDRVPTVAEFLEYWLAQSVAPRLRPLTLAGYTVNVRKHLVPALGKIRLDRLTPQQVQEMMNERLAAGFSAKTVRYTHQVLRTALSVARRWELVDRNVATLVDPPRAKRPTIRPLEPHEARLFLDSLHGNRLEALYSVALALGLRQGEALGLQWRDIDLDAGVLKIRHQLQRINQKLTLVEPKTERSRRALVIPPSIGAQLREHAKRQLAEKLWAGTKWTENDLVFANRVEPAQTFEALPGVRPDRSPFEHVVLDEAAKGIGRQIVDSLHSDPPGPVPADLYCREHDRGCAKSISTAAPRPVGAAYISVVNFNHPSKRRSLWRDHRPPQLVEHEPGRLVALQSKLALQL